MSTDHQFVAAKAALDAEVPLVSEEAWEDLYLVRYPTLEALQGMVASKTWQATNVDREFGLDLTWVFPTRPRCAVKLRGRSPDVEKRRSIHFNPNGSPGSCA